MSVKLLEKVKKDFNDRISFREKKEGIYQVIAPFYHEDGDMYDLFIENLDSENVRVSDHGLTMMRLSYSYDLDTPKKEEIFHQILIENNIDFDDGNLYIETKIPYLYNSIMRFTQVISKIANFDLYKRDVVKSLFYEDLGTVIKDQLLQYSPMSNYVPLDDREDLEVDTCFNVHPKPIFLFGVKDNLKARLVAISCLEYIRREIPFRSIAVHEDFDTLGHKDRRIITNVIDKQFTDLGDFRANINKYIEREIA